VKWLEKAANHQRGILGKPQNRKDRSAETDPIITDLTAFALETSTSEANAETAPAPKIEACRASGLIALKLHLPGQSGAVPYPARARR
jgi:hypothetical protein